MTDQGDLLDAIAEAPNDDGPRLVYADWLQQQPDEASRAHGEYIALACSTARNPKRAMRLQELLDRHGDAWLGPLREVTDPDRRLWARGFFDGCALVRTTPPGSIEPALGHPAWRTLRVIETTSTVLTPEDVARLVCQRETANLKALYTLHATIGHVVESALAPRLLELAIAPSGAHLPSLIRQLDAACFARLRKLHLFGVSPTILASLQRPELTLITVASPRSLPAWHAELAALESPLAEVRLVAGVSSLLERSGHELVLRADGDRRWNRLEVRWTYDNEPKHRDLVIHALRQLPEGAIQRLSFVGPTAARFDTARWRQRIVATLPDAIVE